MGEDYRRGRIYLPQEDLERFGVEEEELAAQRPSERLQALLAFEVERGRRLLDPGIELVRSLSGRAKLAVAGYVGGGRAAFDAIESSGYDVLRQAPKATGGARARATVQVLRRRDERRMGLRVLPGRHAAAGGELLLRHPAPAEGAPRGAVRDLRARSPGGRHRRRPGAARGEARRLGEERGKLASIDTAYDDPVFVALADAVLRYPIPVDAFGELIDGVEMDVAGTHYATFADLLPYCRRVAGAIGRLSPRRVRGRANARRRPFTRTTSASRSS